MKKSLVALAALAAVAAHAQSSVQVYGLVDAGVRNDSKTAAAPATGATGLTAFANGVLNTSRFGFKGTEDLGAGMKANFVLESGFKPGTGAGSASLFDRRAAAGLSGDFGRVDLGRNTTFGYDITAGYVTDPLGQELTNNSTGALNKSWTVNPLGTIYSTNFTTVRRDNAVKYLGKFGDVSVGAAYALGGVAGASSANSSTQVMVRYTGNGADLAASYDDLQDKTAAGASAKHLKTMTVGGNYSFSGVKLTAGYTEQKADAGFTTDTGVLNGASATSIYAYVPTAVAATNGVNLTVSDVGVTYNFTPALNVVVAYYQTNAKADAINSAKLNSAVVRARYALSKQTDLYAALDQTNSSGLAAASASAKATNDTGITAGVQVRF